MLFRQTARKLAPTLTIYLLIVSVGMPLHKVYCACRGAEFISLWELEHKCQRAITTSSEEHHHATACCAAKEEAHHCSDQLVDEDRDCGSSETLLFQLDTEFTQHFTEDGIDHHSPFPLPVVFPISHQGYLLYVPKAIPIRGPTPPPPLLCGRDVLVRHQVFLC